MTCTVTEILDLGGDVLLVRATDADGNEVEAHGWVSATTNHYDRDAYHGDGETVGSGTKKRDVSGHLRDDATARTMTAAEIGDYARRLVAEQHPHGATAEPIPIIFE